MNSLLPSYQPVPLTLLPSGRELLVVLGPHLRQLHPAVLEQAARLALKGPLQILDGGNCLDLYGLARHLRRLDTHVESLLQRIQVARPFTCYQMATLLAQVTCSEVVAFKDERNNLRAGKRENFEGLRDISLPAIPQAPARRGEAALAEPQIPARKGEGCLPTIVLDLLATFLDENVRLPERQRLLADCLGMLHRLAGSVPVLVTAHTSALPGSESLVNILCRTADRLWTPPPPVLAPTQLRLFP